jgi:hypothetical protein
VALNDESCFPTRFGLSANAELARQTKSSKVTMDDDNMVLFLRSMISSFYDERQRKRDRLPAVLMHE